jgi:hypothetical protein
MSFYAPAWWVDARVAFGVRGAGNDPDDGFGWADAAVCLHGSADRFDVDDGGPTPATGV